MHPIEHLFYYSCAALPLLFLQSPFHFMFNIQHAALSPAQSHTGFQDHVSPRPYPVDGITSHFMTRRPELPAVVINGAARWCRPEAISSTTSTMPSSVRSAHSLLLLRPGRSATPPLNSSPGPLICPCSFECALHPPPPAPPPVPRSKPTPATQSATTAHFTSRWTSSSGRFWPARRSSIARRTEEQQLQAKQRLLIDRKRYVGGSLAANTARDFMLFVSPAGSEWRGEQRIHALPMRSAGSRGFVHKHSFVFWHTHQTKPPPARSASPAPPISTDSGPCVFAAGRAAPPPGPPARRSGRPAGAGRGF